MENGWMDWIEWMWMWKVESGLWKVESGAVPDLTLILTYLLSCTVSKLRLIIRQIFASERGVPHFNAIA